MLEQMCRTCLATSGELVPIFSNDYYVHNLPDKLFHTTRIEVLKDDELPKMMCKKCIFIVDSMYCFKDQCEMSEIKLKKTLKSSLDNNIKAEADKSNYVDQSFDKYILGKAKDHSDAISSSDEEKYEVEYASEEARLEVENAKRQSRNAKKKRKRNSGVEIKSIQILPNSDIYKNLSAVMNYSSTAVKGEDANVTDNDDRSSLYASESSNNFTSNTSDRIHYSEPHNSEKSNFLRNKEQLPFTKLGLKRKVENDNSFNQLRKVPKQVIFQNNEHNDENMKCIEKSDNWLSMSDNLPMRIDDDINAIMQLSVDNEMGKIVKHLSFNESLNLSPTNESKKILELRMQNLVKHLSVNIPKICALCSGGFFKSYADVLKHKIEMHLSSDQDFFYCPICHTKFVTSSTIIEHLYEHTDINVFLCILCSKNFYTEENLRNHMLSHVDIRDLKCQACSKRFQRIQGLTVHMDQHITANNLMCTLCSDSFDSKDMLQNHINQIHGKHDGDVPNQIHEKKTRKENHIEQEKCYNCPYCQDIFSLKASLMDHISTHLGTQMYTCLVCEQSFNTQEERTHHMQEHMMPQQKSDRKKFRCRVCHEILISRVAYGDHLKEKHWNSKQTDDILKELSETSLNELLNQSISTPSVSDSLNST